MKTCRTCAWWKIKEESLNYDELLCPEDDDARPIEMPFEVRQCCNPQLLFCKRPEHEGQAAVEDGEGYKARLITGPDFGCTSHEEPF